MKLIDNSELDKKFSTNVKTIADTDLGQVSQGGEWMLNEGYTTELKKDNYEQRACWAGAKGISADKNGAGAGARQISLNFFKGEDGKLISLSTIQRRVKGKLATGTTGVIDSSDVRVLVEGYDGLTLTVKGKQPYQAQAYDNAGKMIEGKTNERNQLILTIE